MPTTREKKLIGGANWYMPPPTADDDRRYQILREAWERALAAAYGDNRKGRP